MRVVCIIFAYAIQYRPEFKAQRKKSSNENFSTLRKKN